MFLSFLPVEPARCGDEEARTPDLRRAKAALSQLSYIPGKVGLVGLEPTTSPLSEERSNRLSYRPDLGAESESSDPSRLILRRLLMALTAE